MMAFRSLHSLVERLEPRPFSLSLISILFTVPWLDVCATFLRPFYYFFVLVRLQRYGFSSKHQHFLEYPLLKHSFN